MLPETDDTTVLPRQDAGEDSPPATLPGPAASTKAADRAETILLVEDDPQARELIRNLLRRDGYQVLTADSESQALWVWERQAHTIDLLLTDVMIPSCATGIQLAKRLRQQRPSLQVICISGFGRDIGSGDTNFVTQFPFLQKPCSARLLLETVHRAMAMRTDPTRNDV